MRSYDRPTKRATSQEHPSARRDWPFLVAGNLVQEQLMDRAEEKIRIGIASCLLGQPVRFDGGHKRDAFIVDRLGNYLDWVAVCPEVEMGMGVPREPIQLVKSGDETRLVTVKTKKDVSAKMRKFAKTKVAKLQGLGVSGYVFKKGSPSCGMERVKVYGSKGVPTHDGRGLFAEELMDTFSDLPVEEEGRLHDPVLRENWLERVFAFHALQKLWQSKWGAAELVSFHTKHKLALLAHSETHYRALGRLVASIKKMEKKEAAMRYQADFMAALKLRATTRKNTNVLLHMVGYFKTKLDPVAKRELLGTIEDYHQGHAPLSVPLTLIAHYVRVFDEKYLAQQSYLNPHPKELALRHFIL